MSLNSPGVIAFEAAVREQAAALSENAADAATISTVFQELTTSGLPDSEVARRVGRFAEMLPGDPGFQQALAAAAAGSEPAVRSAVVALLPASLQKAAYAHGGSGSVVPEDAPPPVEQAAAPDGAVPNSTSAESDEDEGDDWRTVLLLGSAQDIAENAHLLRDKGFDPIRVHSTNKLEALAGERFCGLVIHKSWWLQLPSDEQRVEFVRDQVLRSNLLRMHIDCRGLGEEAETRLAETVEGFDQEIRDRISVANSALLTKVELRGFAAVAELLEEAEAVRIGIEGVDEADRRLIASAVASFAARERLRRTAQEEHLTVRPILEGKSRARVYAVTSAAFRTMLVAKLDPLDDLRKELERARHAMPPSLQIDTVLSLYSLGGSGVLLQRLYTELDPPGASAPSLHERLQQCTAWERGREGASEPDLEGMERAIDRMVNQIKGVNREASDEPESSCWLTIEPLEKFAELGIQWSVESVGDSFDPVSVVPRALEILSSHGRTHVIHGDLHTGNLLMLDEQTPQLIDFAAAGTGHPCFDLVRVSSGIAYEFIRPLDGEASLRNFFTRVHVGGASKDELLKEFPELLCGIGPTLALHALTTCRQAAIEALAETEEPDAIEQYLAMVYLIAAQSLTMRGFQVAVVRSALGAVGPTIHSA